MNCEPCGTAVGLAEGMEQGSIPAHCPARTRRTWDFEVEGHTYHMIVANTRQEREEAYALVLRVYAAQGFTENEPRALWYSIHNALPETVTFLVRNDAGQAVASGTVVPDSSLGLPMERMYSEEMEALRETGRRICEINSLVSTVTEEGWQSRIVIMKVFSAAFAYARNVLRFDDLVCVTSPEHARFYGRVLMLDPIGGMRKDPHANGADSMALRLDMTTAEERYMERYGNKSASRNLFRFFRPSIGEVLEFVEWLGASVRQMDEATFRYFFMDRCDMISALGPEESGCLRNACYHFDLAQLLGDGKELAGDRQFAVA